MADDTARLQAADIITAIKSAGIRFVVAFPDRTTSEHLLKPMLADPERHVVQICWDTLSSPEHSMSPDRTSRDVVPYE